MGIGTRGGSRRSSHLPMLGCSSLRCLPLVCTTTLSARLFRRIRVEAKAASPFQCQLIEVPGVGHEAASVASFSTPVKLSGADPAQPTLDVTQCQSRAHRPQKPAPS